MAEKDHQATVTRLEAELAAYKSKVAETEKRLEKERGLAALQRLAAIERALKARGSSVEDLLSGDGHGHGPAE